MIVILNDNAMSISRNVGSIARYLSYVRAKPGYLNAKDSVEAALCRVPKVGEVFYVLDRWGVAICLRCTDVKPAIGPLYFAEKV